MAAKGPKTSVAKALSQCCWMEHPQFGRVLDMRPFTSTVLSNSSSADVVRQFAFNRGSNGSEYINEPVSNNVSLSYEDGHWGSVYSIEHDSPIGSALQNLCMKPFTLFSAPTMEWKWDCYARAISIDADRKGGIFDIAFCRSWGLLESKMRMNWQVRNDTELHGIVLACDTSTKFANDPIYWAHFDFLIKKLVCGTVDPVPHPLDTGAMFEDEHIESAVYWSFAVHGRQAQLGQLPKDKEVVDIKSKS